MEAAMMKETVMKTILRVRKEERARTMEKTGRKGAQS